jgi:hypothetical protein
VQPGATSVTRNVWIKLISHREAHRITIPLENNIQDLTFTIKKIIPQVQPFLLTCYRPHPDASITEVSPTMTISHLLSQTGFANTETSPLLVQVTVG